ncbi:MAG: hypothetical protein NT000_05455 [Proteobacteria bacterium]|nr:hypothetical protein [Pseudomonadota bacterium]
MSYILIAYVIFSSPAGAEKKGPQDLVNSISIKRGAASVRFKPRGDAFNPRLKVPQPQIDKEVGSDNKNSESSIDPESNKKNKAEDTGTTTNGKSSSLGNQLKTTNENSQAGSQKAESDADRKLPLAQPGQGTNVGSEGKSFGLWWPVCLFIHGPDANQQIKELVSMSAACGVNVKPYPRVVSIANPNDPKAINEEQSQSCNLKEAGIAEKGSTLVITNNNNDVADKMCKSREPDGSGGEKFTTNVAGCNELANGISGNAKKLAELQNTGTGDGGGGEASSSIARGIVDSAGYSLGSVWSHEIMGHGQMGWPNGKGSGNGIANGDDPEDKKAGPEGGAYTSFGCARMRASAISDPEGKHKYYASKTKYYNHESMSKKPLALGDPIWKRFTGGPSLAAAQPKGTPADSRGDEETDSLASAESGHRKTKKNRLTLSGSGKRVTGSTITPNKKPEAVTRGDDSLSEQGGSQVRGGTGEGAPNNTIVGNKDLSLLAKPPDNSEQLDPKFFNNDGNKSSGSNNNANLNSNLSPNLKSNLSNQVADSTSPLDPDFFEKSNGKAPAVVRQLARESKPVTTSDVPEKRKKIPDKIEIDKTVRGLRTQVSFE